MGRVARVGFYKMRGSLESVREETQSLVEPLLSLAWDGTAHVSPCLCQPTELVETGLGPAGGQPVGSACPQPSVGHGRPCACAGCTVRWLCGPGGAGRGRG